jgi:hypothetical protein
MIRRNDKAIKKVGKFKPQGMDLVEKKQYHRPCLFHLLIRLDELFLRGEK